MNRAHLSAVATLVAIFMSFLSSCTPVSKEKSRPIQEIIISEMRMEDTDEKEVTEPEPLLPPSLRTTVRVGILDEENDILFSFSGFYSIHSRGRQIFSRKRSLGIWRVTAQGSAIVLDNTTTGERFTTEEDVVFRPLYDDSFATVGRAVSGQNTGWENTRSRSYRGNIEFISISGRITVVNDVDIEDYVYGVVPSEMPSGAPMEALKAQAILARTNVFSKVGAKFRNKPYSLSSDVYSQVYTGIDHRNDRTDLATDLTKGLILTYDGRPAEALFHSTCGGHTEGNDVIWGSSRLPYLQPKPCCSPEKITAQNIGDLSREADFRRWIDSRPDSYCNLDNKNVSSHLDFARKFYRWEVRHRRRDLERIIRSTTGTDIGEIKDIIVTGRGTSGKAKAVRVEGSKRSITINRELNIRRQLSRPPLYSGNFYVQKLNMDNRGYAETFVFKGAGFGHGTGMCQVGAAGKASMGKNFREIIEFYFPGTKIMTVGEM